MTLAEKIQELRTGRGLSQEELAAQLKVSRQSVSKWETGQSVPDLEKVIKLSDLFGVTVDQLVREGEAASLPEERVRPRVACGEVRPGPTLIQKAGICTEVTGWAAFLLGLMGEGILVMIGLAMVLLGLPLLLARKHPWLWMGWIAVALTLVVLNPRTSVVGWGLIGGIRLLAAYLKYPQVGQAVLLGGWIAVLRGLLVLTLLWGTYRGWKKKKEEA